jgi:hypothetical protein
VDSGISEDSVKALAEKWFNHASGVDYDSLDAKGRGIGMAREALERAALIPELYAKVLTPEAAAPFKRISADIRAMKSE